MILLRYDYGQLYFDTIFNWKANKIMTRKIILIEHYKEKATSLWKKVWSTSRFSSHTGTLVVIQGIQGISLNTCSLPFFCEYNTRWGVFLHYLVIRCV